MADPETQTPDVSDAVGADMGAIWDAAMAVVCVLAIGIIGHQLWVLFAQ